MSASNVKLDHASLWVQIWGAPFDMSSPQVAAVVGGKLGILEEVEKRRKHDDQNYFMRVRVALPISKPLSRGSYLAGSEGERVWVNFKYERLPLFCHYCGFLGHDIRHCARYFAAKKKEGLVQIQYGEWLKAAGGRPRSPQRKTTPSASDDGKVGQEQNEKDDGGPSHAVYIPAADEDHSQNPSGVHVNEKGNNVNQGIYPDIQQNNSETAHN